MRHFAALFLLTPSMFAQPSARTHDITLDDYFSLDIIGQFQVAPDGNHVAYVLMRWDKASDSRKVDHWLVDTQSKKSPVSPSITPASPRRAGPPIARRSISSAD